MLNLVSCESGKESKYFQFVLQEVLVRHQLKAVMSCQRRALFWAVRLNCIVCCSPIISTFPQYSDNRLTIDFQMKWGVMYLETAGLFLFH